MARRRSPAPSTLAGFDLAVMLTPAAIWSLIGPRIAALLPQPPFERTFPLGTDAGGGEAHFVVTDVAPVEINARDTAVVTEAVELTLVVSFARSSILGNAALGTIVGLSGRLTIALGVELAAPRTDPRARQIVVHVERAVARVQIDQAEFGRHASTLARTVQDIVRAGGAAVIDLPIRVDRDAEPSLTPLVVKELRLASVRARQPTMDGGPVLALFANLLTRSGGDPQALRGSGVFPGRDAVLRLSPRAFHRLVFAPAIQAALRVSSTDVLPATCGRSESVPLPDFPEWSVTRVADECRDSGLHVEIDARQVGGGRTLLVSVRGRIVLELPRPGVVRPVWHTDSVSGGVEFGVGWWILNVFVPTWIWMVAAWGAVAGGAASARDAFTPAIPPLALPFPVPGATVTTTWVAADQVGLGATVPRPPVRPADVRLMLAATTATTERTQASAGVYESRGCPPGAYRYTHVRQRQRIRVRATPLLAARPVRYSWAVSGFDPPNPLSGRSGTVTIAADCTHGPPPGTRETRAAVSLRYAVEDDGSVLVLDNDPVDGSYALTVACTVTDHEGRTASASASARMTGDVVEFEDGWQSALADCVEAFRQDLRRYEYGLAEAEGWVRPWDPGDPAPLGLAESDLVGAVLAAAADRKQGPLFLSHLAITGIEPLALRVEGEKRLLSPFAKSTRRKR